MNRSEAVPHKFVEGERECVTESSPLNSSTGRQLGLMPERVFSTTINPHVINFYRWLKRGLVVTLPMANDERLYPSEERRTATGYAVHFLAAAYRLYYT